MFRKSSTRTPAAQPTVNSTPATTNERRSFFGGNSSKSKSIVQNENNPAGFSKQETLSSAHSKLKAAVAAEAEADKALIKSRELVKIARAEITKLEKEAKEESRIAKIHLASAAKFRKEGDKLGKH